MATSQSLAQSTPLTKSDYLRLRNRYLPENIRTIFVLESPPASGRYFYNPGGSLSEPLFRAMMKDVLGIGPGSKEEGLKEFAERGYLLIDATYTPVNDCKKKTKRNGVILRDLPALVDDLRKYAQPGTEIVLVKANVCRLLEPKLRELGLNVANRGTVIPFPSSGQQRKFAKTLGQVLQICGICRMQE